MSFNSERRIAREESLMAAHSNTAEVKPLSKRELLIDPFVVNVIKGRTSPKICITTPLGSSDITMIRCGTNAEDFY